MNVKSIINENVQFLVFSAIALAIATSSLLYFQSYNNGKFPEFPMIGEQVEYRVFDKNGDRHSIEVERMSDDSIFIHSTSLALDKAFKFSYGIYVDHKSGKQSLDINAVCYTSDSHWVDDDIIIHIDYYDKHISCFMGEKEFFLTKKREYK